MKLGICDVIVVRRTKYGTAHTGRSKSYVAQRSEDVEICESVEEQLGLVLKETLVLSKFEPTPAELLRRWAYDLSDPELIVYLRNLSLERECLLSEWERDFRRGVIKFYVEANRITWKQRKYARAIVEKVESSCPATTPSVTSRSDRSD